ncbi:hypothetical protein TIFTF001_014548 [Ficus carica]|uniref:Uncharacterized protein n=1 Tax=Ficus carica TaxID=3494 RepID=A0AA88D483_FICCA|nr:hypothetical protein TIFTF001_014548 [Ficus carica]
MGDLLHSFLSFLKSHDVEAGSYTMHCTFVCSVQGLFITADMDLATIPLRAIPSYGIRKKDNNN